MQTINIIALISPVYACLFFAILLLTHNSEKRSPKTVLGLFMIFAFLLNLSVLFIQCGYYIIASYFHGIFISTMLSLLPLFYLYILSLTDENFKLGKNIYHFIPSFIFFAVVSILLMSLNEKDKVYYITNYMLGDFSDNRIMKNIYIFYRAKGNVFAIQSVVYFFLSRKRLSHHKKTINNMFILPEGLNLNWLYVFNFIYLFCSINATILNFSPTKDVYQKEFVLNTSLIVFAVTYFIYGLLGLRQKSVMQIIKVLDSSSKESEEQTYNPPEFFVRINNHIVKNQVYLNPELKIWDLAKDLNTNRTYISKTINEEAGVNFANYINSFRINKACEYLSEQNNVYQIEDLCILCGFNSVSSFNRAFRQQTGMTPTEYKKINNNV